MVLNLDNIIHILIILQSFLVGVFLVTSAGERRQSNLLLSGFMFGLGMQMLMYLLQDVGYTSRLSQAIIAVVFAYGPLMYLYARSLIYHSFTLWWSDTVHFLPAVLFAILMAFDFPVKKQMGWLLYVSLAAYTFLAFREINRYQKVLNQTRSDLELIKLSWLKLAFGLFVFILSADVINFLLDAWWPQLELGRYLDIVVLLLVLLFVNTMVFKGLKQPQIFQGITDEELALPRDKQRLNQLMILSNNQREIEELERYVEVEKPYTNPTLTIAELAESINLPARRLSEIINGHYQQHFSDFINTHRIELAKKRLINPTDPGETITEVMYEVGFNSKSAFNTAFKKKTGLTPSSYRKKYGK